MHLVGLRKSGAVNKRFESERALALKKPELLFPLRLLRLLPTWSSFFEDYTCGADPSILWIPKPIEELLT